MKTAVTEILNHCKDLLSKGQEVDTQGLVEWIENTLLLKERLQIVSSAAIAFEDMFGSDGTNYGIKYYESKYGKYEK